MMKLSTVNPFTEHGLITVFQMDLLFTKTTTNRTYKHFLEIRIFLLQNSRTISSKYVCNQSTARTDVLETWFSVWSTVRNRLFVFYFGQKEHLFLKPTAEGTGYRLVSTLHIFWVICFKLRGSAGIIPSSMRGRMSWSENPFRRGRL
jgi:hypothetical protein